LNFKRILITGAPGTGKTAVINALENAGFHCFHEVIRSMTLDAKTQQHPDTVLNNPIAFVSDSKRFNQQLLDARKQQFDHAINQEQAVVFYDRGMPDVLAYMDYFEQAYTSDFIHACKTNRYDAVFLLPPWEAIYVQDNERLETYPQATEIHEHLFKTYSSLGYDVMEVPFGTIAERLSFMLNHLDKAHA